MRLFVSVDLPDDLAPPLGAIQRELADASGLSFTDPDQAHVTLKFLGDVTDDRLEELSDAIRAAVQQADVPPFDATVEGLGAFPSHDYIRVVWAGFTAGSTELTRLHEAIDSEMVGLGFEEEEHSFTPHVTLARMEHAGGKELVQSVLDHDPHVGPMTVDAVRLKESTLTPDGPEYTTVERFPL